MGKTGEQIKAFRKAIELDPDNVPVYESLGAALAASGDTDGALKVFREGLEIDPLSAALNFDVSLVLDQKGEKDEAKKVRELALKIDPKVVVGVEVGYRFGGQGQPMRISNSVDSDGMTVLAPGSQAFNDRLTDLLDQSALEKFRPLLDRSIIDRG